MNPKTTEPCYVILRRDGSQDTVKLVVWTRERANSEVTRLNDLNADKGCIYRWEISRALRRDKEEESAGG